MNEKELVENIDFATQAGDVELAETLTAQLEQVRSAPPPLDPIERRAQNPSADQRVAIQAQASPPFERAGMAVRRAVSELTRRAQATASDIAAGASVGATMIKSTPNTLNLMAAASRYKDAEAELSWMAGSQPAGAAGPTSALQYLGPTIAGSVDARARELAQGMAQDKATVAEAMGLLREFQRQMEAKGQGVPEFTDVLAGKGEFSQWLAFNLGQGAAIMVPLILTAAVPGVGPAAAGIGAAALNVADVQAQRLDAPYLGRAGLARPAAIEREADPLQTIDKLDREKGAVLATAAGYTALDFALGPVGRAITGKMGKEAASEALATLSKSEIVKEVLKSFGMQTVEEAINEGGQEFLSVLMEKALDGRDILTAETAKRLINAAAAGAASGGPIGGVQRAGEIGVARARQSTEAEAPAAAAEFDALPDGPDGGKVTPSGAVITAEEWEAASERVRDAWMAPDPRETDTAGQVEEVVASPTEEPGGEAGAVETIEAAPAPEEEPERVQALRAELERVKSPEARKLIDAEIRAELKIVADQRKADELEAEARQIQDDGVRAKLLERAEKIRPKPPTKGITVKEGTADEITAEPVDEGAIIAAAAAADRAEREADPGLDAPKPSKARRIKAPAVATLSGSEILRYFKREGGFPTKLAADLGIDKTEIPRFTLFRSEQPSESGRLFFSKGRLQEDSIIEAMLEFGYMTRAEAEGPDAVRIATDLLVGELRSPGSIRTVVERDEEAQAMLANRERDLMIAEAENELKALGINVAGMTDKQIVERYYDVSAADWTRDHPDLDLLEAIAVRDALDAGAPEEAIERAAIEAGDDTDAFQRRLKELINESSRSNQATAAGRKGAEPEADRGRQGGAATRAQPAEDKGGDSGNASVRYQQGARPAESRADPEAGRASEQPRAYGDRAGGRGIGKTAERKRDAYAADLFGNEIEITPQTLAAPQPPLVLTTQVPALPAGARLATEVRTRQVGEASVGVAKITTAEHAATAFAALRRLPREYFAAIVTDKDGAPIAYWQGHMGASAQTAVYPEELAKFAASVPGAANVWISHNHPSGNTNPSRADELLTNSISELLAGVVSLRGHVIIAGTQYSALRPDGSLAERDERIKPGRRDIKVPMLERMFQKAGKLEQKEVVSPTDAVAVVKRLLPNDEGLVLLDHQNYPIGVLPYRVSMGPQRLRSEDGQKLLGWLAQSGAASVLVRSSVETSGAQTNLMAFMARMGVKPLDVFYGARFESAANKGGPSYPADFMSLADGDLLNAPTFYSQLERAIDGQINAKSMPQSDWLRTIDSLPSKGVKPDEIEWSGLREWLQTQGPRVSKADVLAYLRGNGVQVEEVVLGATPYARYEQELISKYGERHWKARLTDAEMNRLDELASLDDQAADAKYADYQLPGGTNYREVLLTLPAKRKQEPAGLRVKPRGEYPGSPGGFNAFIGDKFIGWGQTEAEARAFATENATPNAPIYKSRHWNQPNVLAHIRLNDRIDAEGKRVLFVEEIQSDWAQKGREKGFGSEEPTLEELAAEIARMKSDGYEQDVVVLDPSKPSADPGNRGFVVFKYRYEEILSAPRRSTAQQAWEAVATKNLKKKIGERVPPAPFVGKTDAWVALALKRVLRMAAEGGYDRVAFTTGEQQAERYDLSKQVDSIKWRRNGATGRTINIELPSRGVAELLINAEGKIVGARGARGAFDSMMDRNLHEAIGKEIAQQVMSDPEGELRGTGLKVGGEGMRAFYDKIVPKVLNDLSKKLGGGKVGSLYLGQAKETAPLSNDDEASGAAIGARPVQSIDISPAMREQIMGGLPLFKIGSEPQARARSLRVAAYDGAAADLLREASQRMTQWFGSPVEFVPADPQDRKALGRVFGDAAEVRARALDHLAATDLAAALGVKTHFYAQRSGPTINGFASNAMPGSIFVSVNGKDPALAVAGHEFLHSLRRQDPDLYADVVRALRPLLRNYETFRAELDRRYTEAGSTPLADNAALEELIADVFGDRWTEPEFYRELAAANPSRFRQLADRLVTFLSNVLNKIRRVRPFGTERYISDLERVRKVVADAVVEFDRRRATRGAAAATAWMDRMALASEDGARAAAARQAVDAVTPAGADTLMSLPPRRQTDSPAFKRWFGNSKVVDANGKPLVVYHGTSADFAAFNPTFMYSGEGASQTGSGFYFTDNADSASRYASRKGDSGGRIMPVYLSLKKPLYIDFNAGEATGARITLTRAQVRKIIESVPAIRSTENSPLLDFGDVGFEGYEKVLRQAIDSYAGGNNIAALRNDFFGNDHAAWLRAFSKATGYDSAYTKTSNGDTHYVAWFPEQIKSAIGNRGTFDPNEQDITLSLPPTTPPRGPASPAGGYVSEPSFLRKLGRRLYSGFIDNLSRLEEVQKETGRQVRDEIDTYSREIVMHGRQTERLKDIQRRYIEPIQRRASKAGLSYQDVSDYMYARHAPEANAYIASINPKIPAGGSGLTDAAAAKIIAGFTPDQRTVLAEIGRLVQQMNREKLNRMVEDGLITAQTRDDLNARFRHWVSLKNLDDESILGATKVAGTGSGLEIKGKEFKARAGRVSRAEDPLSMTIRDAMLAVMRSEKNRVAQSFVRFVIDNPNPGLWRPVTEANYPMRRERNAAGEVVEYKDPGALYREPRYFGAKINGQQVFVELLDEELASQLHKLGDYGFGQDIVGRMLAAVNTVTRTMGMLYTQLNPDFALVNPLRDVQQAIVVATSFDREKGARMARQLTTAFPGALRAAIGQFFKGELLGKNPTGPDAALFRQFQLDGGTTGGFGLMDAEQIQKDMIGQIRAASGDVVPAIAHGAKKLLAPVAALNDSLENMTRFAMYKVALANGFTRQQAAVMAKNVTVNFDKRGEANRFVNAFYVFFNAAIQGNMAVLRAVARSKYARAAALGLFVLGVMQELMGDDDETGTSELDYVSEFRRDRNVVVPLPEGRSVTVPLAYGLNVPFAAGRRIMRVVQGRETPGNAVAAILQLTFSTFVPIDVAGQGVSALTPTPLRPLIDAKLNEDFAGRQIAKENPFDRVTPVSEQYRADANKAFVAIARALNDISGGSEFERGYLDLSPEKMHYVFRQYTGGLAAPVELMALPFADEITPRSVPVVRRFYTQRSEGYYLGQAFQIGQEADLMRKQMDASPGEQDAELRQYVDEVRALSRELDRLNRARRSAERAGDDASEYKQEADQVARQMVLLKNRRTQEGQ